MPLNLLCLRVDAVPDYRLVIGGSMSPSFNDRVVSVLGGF